MKYALGALIRILSEPVPKDLNTMTLFLLCCIQVSMTFGTTLLKYDGPVSPLNQLSKSVVDVSSQILICSA